MKTAASILIVIVFAVYLINGDKNDGCGSLSINLPSKDYTLTLPAGDKKFTSTTDCTIKVTSYKNMEFTFNVTAINFHDSVQCTYNFIAADLEEGKLATGPGYKVCDEATVKAANAPKGKTMYFNIKTQSVMESTKEPTATLNFLSTQGEECGEAIVQLNKAIQNLSLPAASKLFTVDSECDIEVKGFDGKEFIMTIPEITFSNGNCMDSYVAASSDKAQLATAAYKKCGTKPVTESIKSQSLMLYLKVVTRNIDPQPKVTLMFETIFPECGAYDIEFNGDSKDVSLPAMGTFSTKTECILTVSSVNGSNFQMTITEITFSDKCETNYVTASETKFSLPNNNYKHCGTKPVTSPFKSKDGKMFLLIKTENADAKTAVKLHFESGAHKVKPIALAVMFILRFVSISL